MRKYGVMAVVLTACTAMLFASPAHADQYDFINQLDNSGVSYDSLPDMIDIGKELCHDLRSGVTPPVVLQKLSNTGFAPAEVAVVLLSAVDNMCVDAKAGVISWAQDNGYTGTAAA